MADSDGQDEMKVCPAGHHYQEAECPYCPAPDRDLIVCPQGHCYEGRDRCPFCRQPGDKRQTCDHGHDYYSGDMCPSCPSPEEQTICPNGHVYTGGDRCPYCPTPEQLRSMGAWVDHVHTREPRRKAPWEGKVSQDFFHMLNLVMAGSPEDELDEKLNRQFSIGSDWAPVNKTLLAITGLEPVEVEDDVAEAVAALRWALGANQSEMVTLWEMFLHQIPLNEPPPPLLADDAACALVQECVADVAEDITVGTASGIGQHSAGSPAQVACVVTLSRLIMGSRSVVPVHPVIGENDDPHDSPFLCIMSHGKSWELKSCGDPQSADEIDQPLNRVAAAVTRRLVWDYPRDDEHWFGVGMRNLLLAPDGTLRLCASLRFW